MGKFLPRAPLVGVSLGLLVAGGACVDRLPVLSCLTDQTTVTEGEPIAVETITRNMDPDSLIFDWNSTRDTEPGMVTFSSRKITAQGHSAIYDSTGVPVGKYTIRVDANDGKNQASCSVNVTVEKNKQAPSLVCAPSNIRVTKGESVPINLQATDPNNDPLYYTWIIDNVLFTNARPSFLFRTEDRSIGTHILRVRVTDTDRLNTNCQFQVTIDPRPNEHPKVALSLTKNEVNIGETITVVANASDPEGGPVSYAWTVNGRPLSDTSSRIEIDTTGLAGGKHKVTVTVRGDDDGVTTETELFSVLEKPLLRVSRLPPKDPAKADVDESPLKNRQIPSLMTTVTRDTESADSDKAYTVVRPDADMVETAGGDEQQMNEGRTREFGTQETGWGIHTAWAQGQLTSCKASDPSNDQNPCHEFLGKTLETIYSLTDFKTNGRYLRPILIAKYISDHADKWLAIGKADDQAALESAQSRANEGFPVFAVSPFHAAFILPGRLVTSSSWQLHVPDAASFFPRSPSASYLREKLSQAWKKADARNVQLYYRVR